MQSQHTQRRNKTSKVPVDVKVWQTVKSTIISFALQLLATVPVSKMASADGNEELDLAQWKSFVELGREAGLRKAGFSETDVVQILEVGGREPDIRAKLESLSSHQRAVLLATCGRGEIAESDKDKSRLSLIGWPELSDQEATALCANLSSNTTISSLTSSSQVFGTPRGCTLLGDALETNSAICVLYLWQSNMGSGAVRCLLNGLHGNKTLTSLNLSSNPLLDEGIGFVGEFLCSNSTLTFLNLDRTSCGFKGARHMATALEHNITLLSLRFGYNSFGRAGMKKLIEPLSQDSRDLSKTSDSPKNTSLKFLYVESKNREDICVESMAWMIRTNKTLIWLGISFVPLVPEDWTDNLFPALRENEGLGDLQAINCGGLTGDDAREALMDLILESNTGLQGISLRGTGMNSWQGRVDEELRVNREYRDLLRGQTQVSPTSGRLVLCGHGFAGWLGIPLAASISCQ